MTKKREFHNFTSKRYNPLTPSLPVEKQKERLRASKKKKQTTALLDKKLNPIIKESLHEALPNSMTIDSTGKLQRVWRPNGFRLKIPLVEDFILFKYSSFLNSKTTIDTIPKLRINEHTRKVSAREFFTRECDMPVTITLNKSCIVVMMPRSAPSYVVTINCVEAFDEWIDKKTLEIEKSFVKACEEFVKLIPVKPDYGKRMWLRQENEIHGDEFIDGLPEDMIVHDTYFKKVYDKGVEFKDVGYVKNYISNRAIENVAPVIANELVGLRSQFSKDLNVISGAVKDMAVSGKFFGEKLEQHVSLLDSLEKATQQQTKSSKAQAESSKRLSDSVEKLSGSMVGAGSKKRRKKTVSSKENLIPNECMDRAAKPFPFCKDCKIETTKLCGKFICSKCKKVVKE